MAIPLPLLAAFFVLASGPSRPRRRGGLVTGPSKLPAKAQNVQLTVAELGYSEFWQTWATWVAYGESRWRINAQNNSPGERAASAKAYARLVDQGRWPMACPPRPGLGSGGWYGQLYPFTVLFLTQQGTAKALACDPATAWKNPLASTVAHFRMLEGVLANARAQSTDGKVTVLQMRAKYGRLARNVNTVDTPERRSQYTKSMKKAGIDPAFLDAEVPDFDLFEVEL